MCYAIKDQKYVYGKALLSFNTLSQKKKICFELFTVLGEGLIVRFNGYITLKRRNPILTFCFISEVMYKTRNILQSYKAHALSLIHI